jgi:hypothetical protein
MLVVGSAALHRAGRSIPVPDGFWFVSLVVVGLVVASEWARRVVVGGMRSPPGAQRDELHERRGRTRVRTRDERRGARVLVPKLPRNEVVAIPQWQKDP